MRFKYKYIIAVAAVIAATLVPYLSPSQADASVCYQQSFKYTTPKTSGSCVSLLQTYLNKFKCDTKGVDGVFGSFTDRAARYFQAANGLYVDGIVGPVTWSKLTSATAKVCPADNDVADRALCTNYTARCILVHEVAGKNVMELYYNRALVASTYVNTGKEGVRTRNSTGRTIFEETFYTEALEGVNKAGTATSPAWFKPGVRQITGSEVGLMGDPHKFDGGQAIHWRVAYSGRNDAYGRSIPVIYNGLAQENAVYNGGYASHGCVHTPKSFIDRYDADFFQYGVKVVVQDQPIK